MTEEQERTMLFENPVRWLTGEALEGQPGVRPR